MSNFNIVFRNEIMIINFGELYHGEIINLCDFMKVSQFPIGFFRDLLEDMTDLSFHFTSAERVIVTMNDVQVYSGDFSESWNTYEYYNYFNGVITDLRAGDREMTDDLYELTRDLDYLNLFEEYIDQQEAEAEEIDTFIRERNERRQRRAERRDEKSDDAQEDHA